MKANNLETVHVVITGTNQIAIFIPELGRLIHFDGNTVNFKKHHITTVLHDFPLMYSQFVFKIPSFLESV